MDQPAPLHRGVLGELFWNVDDPVLVLEGDKVVAWNPASERKFGVPVEAALDPGFDLASVFGEAYPHLIQLARREGKATLNCIGGCGIVFAASAWQLEGSDDHPSVVLLRDVSEERRHVANLQRINAIASDVLAADTPLDVLLQRVVDEARSIVGASFSALLTLKPGSETEVDNFVYNAPRELFPDRLPRIVGLLAIPIRTRTPARLDDIRGHPAGVGIPVEHPPIGPLLAVPMIVEDTVIGELAVANPVGSEVFSEVDEEILVELASQAAHAINLAEAREAKLEAEEARRAFMDLVRHDLRNPILTGKGCLSLLTERSDQLTMTERNDLIAAISRSLDRIENLTNDLLVDHLLDTSDPREGFETIDLARLVEDLTSDLTPLANLKDISLEFVWEPDAPATFEGSPTLARHALENLLNNAIKYSPPSTPVAVTIRREGESIRFDVRDRGPGIEPHDQSKLFTRLKRSRRSIEEGIPGMGLGLSIVKRAATVHGGAVGVASQAGHGATFWITFPIGREDPAA